MGNNNINDKNEYMQYLNDIELACEKALENEFLSVFINTNSFANAEQSIIDKAMKLCKNAMSSALKQIDDGLFRTKPKNLTVKSIEKKTLMSLAGSISFNRRRYKNNNNNRYEYLLDKYIGIIKKHRLTPRYRQMITQCSINTSYRKALAINNYYSKSMTTAPTAQKAVKDTALKIENDIKKRQIKINKYVDIKPEKQTKTLYSEADGVYIHIQRPKGCDKSKVKRQGQNMDVVKVYEGKKEYINEKGKKAYKSINTQTLASMCDDSQTFYDKTYAEIISKYDVNVIEKSYLSTDGEKKYKNIKDILPNTPKVKTIHILDKWHVYNALKTFDNKYKQLKLNVIKYLYEYDDFNKAIEIIDNIKKSEVDKKWIKKLNNLKTYLLNNKDSISSKYPSLGTMESTNAHLIGARMKSYGGAWSKKGANAMGLCLSAYFNNGQLPVINDKEKHLEKELLESIPKYMSINKAIKLSDNIYDYPIKGKLAYKKDMNNNFVKRRLNIWD
jgi:hypothetical protein